MVVVFVVSINFPTAYFWWSLCGVLSVLSMWECGVFCFGDATIFLPWVLHFLGVLFCYWGVIFGVGFILN